MEQTMIFRKLAQKPVFSALNDFVNSKYCIAVLAVLTLVANTMGLELYVYSAVFLYAVYFVLFGKDLLPLVPGVMLMYVSPSVHNNPAVNPESIFYPKNGLWLLIVYLVIVFSLVIVRICLRIGWKKFLTKKRFFSPSLLVLGATFALGGLLSDGYGADLFANVRYGLLLFISFWFIYFIVTATVDFRTVPEGYFAWCGVFLAITVSFEVLSVYLQLGIIDSLGSIQRGDIHTGWGVYNNMACMIVVGIPCAFYFAATRKHGYIFNILATVFYIAVIFSNSRNGMLMGVTVYALSALCLWIYKREKRIETLILFGIYALIVIGLLVFNWDGLANLFSNLAQVDLNDAGRFETYKKGFVQFLKQPLFGQGFFACEAFKYGEIADKMTLFPARWHNTLVQFLASCGLVGTVAYAWHRWLTVKFFWKRRNMRNCFLGLAMGSILLLSLLDCHLFNIGPGLVYSGMLALLENGEEPNEFERAVKRACGRRIK